MTNQLSLPTNQPYSSCIFEVILFGQTNFEIDLHTQSLTFADDINDKYNLLSEILAGSKL